MSRNVAIVGIGYTNFRPLTPEVSYKELMYEAAVKAYEDAGIDPRRDVDSFVTVAEDFIEGTSIFDEYVPDQIGGLLKPNVTIPGEAIHGLATAYMQIASGLFDIVAVEAHSKASNVLTLPYITAYAMDPVLNRPLGANPDLHRRHGDDALPVGHRRHTRAVRPGGGQEQAQRPLQPGRCLWRQARSRKTSSTPR